MRFIYLVVCVLIMPATLTIALPATTDGIEVVSNVNVKRAPPNNESLNQTDKTTIKITSTDSSNTKANTKDLPKLETDVKKHKIRT